MSTYDASFSVGQRIKIRSRSELDDFKREWLHHDPLTDEQLPYAEVEDFVDKVGYYHGGYVLYVLHNVPGIWHECCLKASG